MDITPSPAFMEAVRQVLDITDLVPGPDVVIPALREHGAQIEAVHQNICASHAGRVADEQAAEMRRKLEGGTPKELGYDNMTAAELVASEWKCWYEQIRSDEDPEDRIIAHVGHADPSDSSSPFVGIPGLQKI